MKIRNTARSRKGLLELSNLRMHELPDGFRDFGCVRELNLGYNFLVGTVFDTLHATCTNLTSLDLSNNFLSGELPSTVGGLTNLVRFTADGTWPPLDGGSPGTV